MQNTTISPGSAQKLRILINQQEKKRIFLVTGKKSFAESGAKSIIEKSLGDLETVIFYDFQTNPDIEDVKKGISLFNQSNAEIIVAIGGGSVIDMGKLINYYHNIDTNIISEQKIDNPQFAPVPFICMPTTAGSGSEATHFAVMYIGNSKFSVAHQSLIPDYVIIDPELHYSQTPYQKAVSGVDALAQAIESFWSVQSTEESRGYSERAFKLIWENLYNVVHKGDEMAHLKVAFGAHLSGKAINIAKTTAPHAFSYGITKTIGVPHGHAVALFLPFFIFHCNEVCEQNCNDPRGVDYVITIMQKVISWINVDTNNAELKFLEFLNSLGISINLSRLKIPEKLFFESMKSMNYERLKNYPTKIDSSISKSIFHYLSSI